MRTQFLLVISSLILFSHISRAKVEADIIVLPELTITGYYFKDRKNVKSADKLFREQILEALTSGIPGPSSPTNLEKNQNIKLLCG